MLKYTLFLGKLNHKRDIVVPQESTLNIKVNFKKFFLVSFNLGGKKKNISYYQINITRQ